jgi:hypothetical protein
MSNMRIISDNAADRATLTASSTAGALSVTNLQTDVKSDVWRAIGTSARLTATWAALETIQGVALPFCNLSPTALMRVRVTSEGQATNLISRSQEFDNAAWATVGTLAANAATAPDGTATADKLTGTSSDGACGQSFNTSAGTQYTISVWVRADSALTCSLRLLRTSDGNGISAGLAVTTSWQRFTLTVTANSAAYTFQLGGDGSLANKSIYIWGAQAEAGPAATSYYPTSSAAATRPLGYIDSWQSYTYDSGQVLACPAPAVVLRGWTAAQAASAYAYGGGSYARTWLPTAVQAYGMAVDIVDVGNLQGYVEAGRLVSGPYWSPTYNASKASMTVIDTTELYRTDAGDQGAAAGHAYRRVPIDLSLMPASDRTAFVNFIRSSRAYPVLLSVFPESDDLELERDHMIYGRRSKDSDIAIEYASAYSTTVEIEEA